MSTFQLLICAALALLNVVDCSRLHHHTKRHRVCDKAAVQYLSLSWTSLFQVQNSEDVDAPVVVSATLNSDDNAADGAVAGELPYCFSWEPCQFVFTKKNPKDNMPVKKTIPSW